MSRARPAEGPAELEWQVPARSNSSEPGAHLEVEVKIQI